MAEVDSGAVIQGVQGRNLDFSQSRLEGLHLMRGQIENCRFDDCLLQDVRLWAVTFRGSSFRRADLRGSVLGGVLDGTRNTFLDVDFSGANLARTIYQAAAFERCLFANAKLAKIVNVDFTQASLRDVGFRGLVLGQVRFPDDKEHLVIKDFVSALDQMAAALLQPDAALAKN